MSGRRPVARALAIASAVLGVALIAGCPFEVPSGGADAPPGTPDAAGPRCGDGQCTAGAGETTCSCPDDCGAATCGDTVCCASEAGICASDCPGSCGDGTCNPGEDVCGCPDDCTTAT